jgi:L-asparaginase II
VTTKRAAVARKAARPARAATPPVLVEVRRGDIVESRHRGHVVQVGPTGEVERAVGDPDVVVTLRSTVKPFALVTLLESGAADDLRLSSHEVAVMAGSHTGEDRHVRTLQAVFRRAGVSQATLACGSVGMPLDRTTAARLARDGEEAGAIRHMCSGYHTALILLSRFAGWPLDGYAAPDHPAQVAARETVARLFGVRSRALVSAVDDCGVPTYAFPLVAVARAYLLLAHPEGAAEPEFARSAATLTRVRDAMIEAPDMVGGPRDALDTELMRRRPGVLVSKAGAEGLRAVGLLGGSRGDGRGPAGLALSIEDGDGFRRASRAATVEALAQVGVLDEDDVRALDPFHRSVSRGPSGEVIATTVPGFQLAPISELV